MLNPSGRYPELSPSENVSRTKFKHIQFHIQNKNNKTKQNNLKWEDIINVNLLLQSLLSVMAPMLLEVVIDLTHTELTVMVMETYHMELVTNKITKVKNCILKKF